MLLIIDNFDSFTYNLYQLASTIAQTAFPNLDVIVRRCNEITLQDIRRMNPSHIMLSPGPGRPADARLSCDVIRHFMSEKPILGVCLGHQCLAEVMGGEVIESPVPVHGKNSEIYHDGRGVFHGIPSPFRAIRYHSLTVSESSLKGSIEVTARTREGEVMGLRLSDSRVESVQFHPESILTDHGAAVVSNFLRFGCTSSS
jgi:anthranilate synthase/aminodeoxychorismate synthase-like glutamine amidotransferase